MTVQTTGTNKTYDVIFAGAGLANCLAAYRLKAAHPDMDILLVDAADTIGGNHTWSFHTTDVSKEQYRWLQPFVATSWKDQKVIFPDHTRTTGTGYNSVTSDTFAKVITEALGDCLLLGTPVKTLAADGITLDNGHRLEAKAVIDGRGAKPDPNLKLAFQKFVGLEIRTKQPHGETTPVIMDGSVEQLDGYRFVYTLPFDDHRIMVEDTYYSDGKDLSKEQIKQRLFDYIASKGWEIDEIEREEDGILPITLDGDIEGYIDNWTPGVARSGMRAALFHPTTGYSLPDAVQFADKLAELTDFSADNVVAFSRNHTRGIWNQRRYFRALNRVLFLAPEPQNRYIILQRFYTLSENLINRFYAGKLTVADQVRILVGKPPVSIVKAIKTLPASSARHVTNT